MTTLDEQLRKLSSYDELILLNKSGSPGESGLIMMVVPPFAEGVSLPKGVMVPVILTKSSHAYKPTYESRPGFQTGSNARVRATLKDEDGNQYYLYHDPQNPGQFIALNQDEWNAQIWRGLQNFEAASDDLSFADVLYNVDSRKWLSGFHDNPATPEGLGVERRGNEWVYSDTGQTLPDSENWLKPNEAYLRGLIEDDGSIPQASLGTFSRVELQQSGMVRVSDPPEPEPEIVVLPEPVVTQSAPEQPSVDVARIAKDYSGFIEALRDLSNDGFDETPSAMDFNTARQAVSSIARIMMSDRLDGGFDRLDEISAYVAGVHPDYRGVVIDYVENEMKIAERVSTKPYTNRIGAISRGEPLPEDQSAIKGGYLDANTSYYKQGPVAPPGP